MTQALVIGAGVIGLTSAIRLLENGFSVKIITRDLPQQTTSTVAGAIWAGHVHSERQKQWSIGALKTFQKQAQDSESGVLITRFREVFAHQEDAPWFKDLLDYCKPMSAEQLPEGCVSGWVSDVPLVQTPVYLEYLLKRFYALGGELEEREVQSLDELSDHNLIINCTGVSARDIANDTEVYPVWGQVILANAPHITESIMHDEQHTYIFPRKDGVILGGIYLPNRWEREVDDELKRDIIARCQQIEPQLGDVEVIRIPVGLRPGRYEVRLEREQLNDNCTVIHNYGHAGIGYTLSWGCAEEVLELARESQSQ